MFGSQDLTWKASGSITAGCSAADFSSKIEPFYEDKLGLSFGVTLLCKDSDEVEVDCSSEEIEYHIYTVKLTEATLTVTTSDVMIIPQSSYAEVTIIYPVPGASTGHMSGAYYIECVDPRGSPSFTNDIDISKTLKASELKEELTTKCPFLRDLVVVLGS